MKKTIFALATSDSISAIGIIRLSGPRTFDAIGILCHCEASNFKKNRKLYLKKFYSSDKTLLDEGLVVCFEKDKSFTSENMAELHIHGSPIVIKTILVTLSKIPFIREAFPGEFTQRALENNKLSLSQVEGLSDLMNAETEYQQKQAQGLSQAWMDQSQNNNCLADRHYWHPRTRGPTGNSPACHTHPT